MTLRDVILFVGQTGLLACLVVLLGHWLRQESRRNAAASRADPPEAAPPPNPPAA